MNVSGGITFESPVWFTKFLGAHLPSAMELRRARCYSLNMKKPNILIVTSDQHRYDCFGHMGRKILTPHLDALAASGARFDAAITPNVVCQPARSSILTGLLPLSHGVYDNKVSLDPKIGEAGWAGTLSKAISTPFSHQSRKTRSGAES